MKPDLAHLNMEQPGHQLKIESLPTSNMKIIEAYTAARRKRPKILVPQSWLLVGELRHVQKLSAQTIPHEVFATSMLF